MIIDICIALFLVICVFIGDRRGFILSLLNTFSWAFSLGASYLFRDRFADYLESQTSMHHDITVKVNEFIRYRIQLAISGEGTDITGIPSNVSAVLGKATENTLVAAADTAAAPIANAIFDILAMVLLLVAIRLVMYIIEKLLRIVFGNGSPAGSLDSILGMVFSLIRGFIITYLVLMAIFIIAMMGNIDLLLDQVSSSFVFSTLTQMGVVPDTLLNIDLGL